MEECVFCRIVGGDIPASKVYEDQDFVAFHDIHPAAPIHILLIPKLHIASLYEVNEADQLLLGKMLWLVPQLAKQQGGENGFRTIINTGRAGGQEVFHLHIHIIGGKDRLPGMIHHGQ